MVFLVVVKILYFIMFCEMVKKWSFDGRLSWVLQNRWSRLPCLLDEPLEEMIGQTIPSEGEFLGNGH
jgi:hypothetical protein